MHWLMLSALLELTLPSKVSSQPTSDACRSQIPEVLGQALQRRFPERRLPSVSDSGGEDVQFDRTRGGNGCLLVKRADFDGDGREDITVGLATALTQADPTLALRRATFEQTVVATMTPKRRVAMVSGFGALALPSRLSFAPRAVGLPV
jgi:hypothetical protein